MKKLKIKNERERTQKQKSEMRMSDAKRMEKGLYIEERGRAVKDRGQGRLDLDRWLSAVGFENKELPPRDS